MAQPALVPNVIGQPPLNTSSPNYFMGKVTREALKKLVMS